MTSQKSPNRLTPEKARRAFRDEAARAWRDYVKTGRHTTQDELDAWIDSITATS